VRSNQGKFLVGVVFLIAMLLSTESRGQNWSARAASLALSEGLTEAEAINRIGWRPNYAEIKTCGSNSPYPWTCRILYFGPPGNQLMLFFERGRSGNWVVNGWSIL